MNAKTSPEPSTRDTAGDTWLGATDNYGLSTNPFPSGLTLTAWRGASRPIFSDAIPEPQQPVTPSLARAAFAVLLAVGSILLVVFSVYRSFRFAVL
ncbi:MAG: hypothetical protein ABI831_15880 [Betaproteobacteria bacterium]